jgi:hypothetical protein
MFGGHLPELILLLTVTLGSYTTVRATMHVHRRLRERNSPPIVAAGAATGTAVVLFLLGLWPLVAVGWCARAVWRRGRAMLAPAPGRTG